MRCIEPHNDSREGECLPAPPVGQREPKFIESLTRNTNRKRKRKSAIILQSDFGERSFLRARMDSISLERGEVAFGPVLDRMLLATNDRLEDGRVRHSGL